MGSKPGQPGAAEWNSSAGGPPRRDPVRLGIARYLAWVSLVLVLGFAVTLAVIFGNAARDTLVSKQRNFAGILAEHLNQQIFMRFSIPAVANYGRLNLKQNAQYVLLDQTVTSLIHGLHVRSLRIFSNDGEIRYSSRDREEVGAGTPATEAAAKRAEASTAPFFTVINTASFWDGTFFFFRLKPDTYSMRTTYSMRPVYSLRVENTGSYSSAAEAVTTGPSLGVLEFTQDITGDMVNIIRLQWIIVGVTLASASLLFLLLMVFLRRAEAALAQRVEEEQRLLNELHQHEKLAGMGRVVAGIAHEIRNPLGIIRSSAELLLSRQAGSDPLTGKILQAIFDEARRLSQTVSDFLDYARPRTPQQDPVDVIKVTSDVLAFLEAEMNARHVAVTRDFALPRVPGNAAEGLFTRGDKDLLYRAFYNVLSNSVQAMNGPGSVSIRGRIVSVPGGEAVELVFADNGPGFPADQRERLLDPFVTTKDGGTGLGLPIVNNIITSHGGRLELEDAPGGGAQVRITLPAV